MLPCRVEVGVSILLSRTLGPLDFGGSPEIFLEL